MTGSGNDSSPAVYAPGDHLKSLDGLRGVAILLVLLCHSLIDFPADTFLGKAVQSVGSSTWWGVDVFLVLSGFLVTGVLLHSKEKPRYFRRFYGRRAVRIMPLYFLLLILLLWLGPLFSLWELPPALSGWNQLWYWSYLANIHFVLLPPGADLFHTEHLWALCVEEQFYLFWPLLVLICSPKQLKGVAIGIILGSTLLRLGGWLFWDWSAVTLYKMTPLRIDGMAAGALLALLIRSPGFLGTRIRLAQVLMALSILGLLALGLPMRGLFRTPALLALGMPLFALMSCSLMYLLLSNTQSALNRVLQQSWLCFFGRVSYAAYLVQPFVIAGVKSFWRDDFLPALAGSYVPGRIVYTLLMNGLTLLLALLSWQLIEKHCLALKSRIR